MVLLLSTKLSNPNVDSDGLSISAVSLFRGASRQPFQPEKLNAWYFFKLFIKNQ